jgi:hypothetical protein
MDRLTSSTTAIVTFCTGRAEWPVNECPNHSLFGKGQGKIIKSSFGVQMQWRPASWKDAGRLIFVATPVRQILR